MGDRWMDWKTVEALIESAAGQDVTKERRQEYRRELADYAAELAGPSPTPIERALAETAATCWFDLRVQEMTCAVTHTSMALAQVEYFRRGLDRAYRRFLSVI